MEVCSVDVVVFQSSMISLCWTRHPCISSVSHIETFSYTPPECTPSTFSCSEVVHNFPYSCFIDLLCDFLNVRDWSCHEPLHQSRLAINTTSQNSITRFSVDVCLVVIPRILLAHLGLVPIRARLPVLNSQASQRCSSGHSLRIVHEMSSESSPSASEF